MSPYPRFGVIVTSNLARALRALADIKVHMLSLSSTGINLTVIVDEQDVAPAMRQLHAAFFPAEG